MGGQFFVGVIAGIVMGFILTQALEQGGWIQPARHFIEDTTPEWTDE
jgi:hypothetical protein